MSFGSFPIGGAPIGGTPGESIGVEADGTIIRYRARDSYFVRTRTLVIYRTHDNVFVRER